MQTLTSAFDWLRAHATAEDLLIVVAIWLFTKFCELVSNYLLFRYTPEQFEALKKSKPLLAAFVLFVKGAAADGAQIGAALEQFKGGLRKGDPPPGPDE